MKESGERIVRVALFVGTVALALGVSIALGRFAAPERWEYSEIARNALDGRGLYYQYFGTTYHFYGPPLYPALLAGAMWLGPWGEGLVLVLQALALGATATIVAHITRPMAGATAALMAGAFVATHPGALIYAGKLHSQTLDVLLIVLAFFLVLDIDAESDAWAALRCGVAVGLAVLSRGTIAPFVAAWTLWLLWHERRRWRRTLRVMLVVALGGLVVLVPMIVRGYALYGRLVPLRTDTGVNLWYGNHPGASGTSHTSEPTPAPVTTQIPHDLLSAVVGRDEMAQNRLFMTAALRFMRDEPTAALRLFIRKLYYFWWFSPHAGLLYPAGWRVVAVAHYVAIVLVATIGVMAALRGGRSIARRTAGLFLLLAVTMSLTQAAFYVEGRHRWQVELLLLAFAAVGVTAVHRARGPAGGIYRATSRVGR